MFDCEAHALNKEVFVKQSVVITFDSLGIPRLKHHVLVQDPPPHGFKLYLKTENSFSFLRNLHTFLFFSFSSFRNFILKQIIFNKR